MNALAQKIYTLNRSELIEMLELLGRDADDDASTDAIRIALYEILL